MIGVWVKSSVNAISGTPPKAKYPEGPEVLRSIIREKRSFAMRPLEYRVLKIGL